ncbi:MAG: hypothetical protein QOK11_432 [Pseudonocardiales bacterium]|nr:hypothetical protein [Pseudonocardiales bacterium]MDT4944075.1 hypothetical protein [Pseudonocardiales bacterium]
MDELHAPQLTACADELAASLTDRVIRIGDSAASVTGQDFRVGTQRRSSRCLHATSRVALGNALRRALGIGLPQLSQNP